jgi:hypothetical protein
LSEPNPTVTNTTTSGSPSATRISDLFAGQLEQSVKATGGLPAALRPISSAFIGPNEKQYLGAIQDRAGSPLATPEEQQGMQTLQGLTDPTAQVAQAGKYFNDIAAPALLNQSSASGVGARSGGASEALSRGAAEMTLPIYQQAAQAGSNYGAANLNLGKTLDARAIQQLKDAYAAAGAPRQAQYAEALRPINTIIQLLGGAGNINPGGGTTTSTQSGGGQSNAQLGLGAGSIIANLLGSIF